MTSTSSQDSDHILPQRLRRIAHWLTILPVALYWKKLTIIYLNTSYL